VELSGGQTAYTLQAPSSGPLVAFMLNVLDGFIPAADDVTTHQRFVETMKYAYGMRTRLGDPQFVDIDEVILLCLYKSGQLNGNWLL
jgi:gamma-glutamyltranspeptidase / glutathione hydrolase / leukotriene-C4 hydrolase